MAAPHAHDQPELPQLSLVAAADVQLLEYAVWGRIARQAQVRTSTDGTVHLVVEVLQPKGRLPFVVVRHARQDTADELRHLGIEFKAGTAVVIRCRGIELGKHDGHDVLKPTFCDGICAARFSPFNPEIAP